MKIRRRDDGDVTDEDRLNTVLSFKNVKWINSPGIGILVRNYSHYLRFGGQMVICQLNTRISIVFDLMIRKVFEIYETIEEAVEVTRKRASALQKKDAEASATS
jgi:anti-anti-sigma regulatory factor